jgi:hypothetical protein
MTRKLARILSISPRGRRPISPNNHISLRYEQSLLVASRFAFDKSI